MSEHYFTRNPQAPRDRMRLELTSRGYTLKFMSDAGVFSKKGIDYGSKLLIDNMDIPLDAAVLDVGCGYGPIGLFAARLAKEGFVTLADINERAAQLAEENARLNEITNVQIVQGDLFEPLDGRQFDRIVTNPPIRAGKQTVHRIFEAAHEHLRDRGELWLVIRKKQGAPSAQKKLESLFTQVDEICKDKGYRIYRAVK